LGWLEIPRVSPCTKNGRGPADALREKMERGGRPQPLYAQKRVGFLYDERVAEPKPKKKKKKKKKKKRNDKEERPACVLGGDND